MFFGPALRRSHASPSQAVAALSLHGAPVARPVAGTVPALPRSAAAPPARPVAPGAGSLTLPPKPERVERVERVEVLSRSVKLTLPVKEEMEGSQGAQNGVGAQNRWLCPLRWGLGGGGIE